MTIGEHPTTRLDTELLRVVNRFGLARSHHLALWTGASPFTVRSRMTLLAKAGAVESRLVPADLVGADRRVHRTTCRVWEVTPKGARSAGEWVVPGSGGQVLGIAPRRTSDAMVGHSLGCLDVAVWFRLHGWAVTAEREILSLERESKIAPDRLISSNWSVMPLYAGAIHAPDLGVIDPSGTSWAIELERALKTVDDYRKVIAAYREARMGQVWFVLRNPTSRRLVQACGQLGVQWAEGTDTSVLISEDGTIRLAAWRPGRAQLSKPTDWLKQVSRKRGPAGFPAADPLPDLSAEWRRGALIDLDDETWDPDASGRLLRFTRPGTKDEPGDDDALGGVAAAR